MHDAISWFRGVESGLALSLAIKSGETEIGWMGGKERYNDHDAVVVLYHAQLYAIYITTPHACSQMNPIGTL